MLGSAHVIYSIWSFGCPRRRDAAAAQNGKHR